MDESPSRYRRFYRRIVALATSPYAIFALIAVSIADASVFPIPPFALLVPMVAAQPKRWWFFASIGAVASFFGGMLGYYLGSLLHDGAIHFLHIDLNAPVRVAALHIDSTLGGLLGDNFWILALLCSILPTPFKVVSIGSGLVAVPFTRFLLAAALGRVARFLLVSIPVALVAQRALKAAHLTSVTEDAARSA